MPERFRITFRGWDLIVLVLGFMQLAIGGAMLANGERGLAGLVFTATANVPWWGWGAWAVTVGGAMLAARGGISGIIRLTGTAGATLWYAVWAASLTIGIVTKDGPFYAIPVYLGLAALHILVAAVEWGRREP